MINCYFVIIGTSVLHSRALGRGLGAMAPFSPRNTLLALSPRHAYTCDLAYQGTMLLRILRENVYVVCCLQK
jgi:hypothetical protein